MKTQKLALLLGIFLFAGGMAGLALASARAVGLDQAGSSVDFSASTLTAPVKIQINQPISYTISLIHMGGALSETSLSNVLPYGTSYMTGSLTCSDGNCWFDDQTNAIRWEGALANSAFPKTRYYFTSLDGTNTVYMAELIREGWFVTGTWRTVGVFNVSGLADTVGIDFDSSHGILYHSDYTSNQIVLTDITGNVLTQFECPTTSGISSGVTYLEGSSPPEVWVTDFVSNLTTRCLAPDGFQRTTPPSDGVIEVFTNTWSGSASGLVYNPLEGFVRYAHEEFGPNEVTLWDIASVDHRVILSTSLSAQNPDWSYLWNKRNGIEWDQTSETYYLTDYNGSLNIDDNLIEINPAGVILHAWELDGSDNDSYDGSAINKVIDLAIVPVIPVSISFAVKIDAAPTHTITNIVSLTHSTLTVPVTLEVSTEIVENLYEYEDFERNDGNFSPTPNSEWQWGIPSPNNANGPNQAHTGQRVWGTDLLGDADDEVLSHTLSVSLTLPISPTDLALQWWDWYATDGDDSRSILVNEVEIWSDNGGDSQPEWINHTVNLSAWAGETVSVTFRLKTCCANPGPPGWYLDDIALHTQLKPPQLELSGVPVQIHVLQNSQKTTYFDIHNAGSLGLQWSLTETALTQTNSVPITDTIPWLTALTPAGGMVGKDSSQSVGITANAIGLTPGIYTGTLLLTSNDKTMLTYFIPVEMIVSEPIIYLPIVQH